MTLQDILMKIDGTSWKRLSVAFGAMGALALLQNAGGLSRGGRSPSYGNGDEGRSLALEDHEVSVTQVNDRVLQVAVNGIAEGFYTQFVGPSGTCLSALGVGYDYARWYESSLEQCAKRCSKHLLLSEHRGFNFDSATNDCCCLFDDRHIPLSEKQKANEFNNDYNGAGPIDSTNTATASYQCFVKEQSKVGSPIDAYQVATCSETQAACGSSTILDSVSFGEVYSSNECAEKCLRFKLFQSHTGFTYDLGICQCLFCSDEAPQPRKLSGSGATRQPKLTYQDRYNSYGTPESVECYDKKQMEGAPVAERVPVDTSQRVWINEFHYRNQGPNEPFIEVIGPKGSAASAYEIIVYQGRNGAIHNTIPLTGNFEGSAADWGYVTVDLASYDVRKGKQGGDGLGLVNTNTNTCVQLLSYTDVDGFDRSFKASEGVCAPFASTPIGVMEDRNTPLGHSLQLAGTGNTPSAFTWNGHEPSTKGDVNAGQNLSPP